MAPIINLLSERYGDQILFTNLDIDDARNEPYIQALGAHYQPHIFLLDGQGNVLRQWGGFVTEEALVEAFSAAP
jgi:hypothetical protein